MIYPYHHWESGILPKPRGVVSPEDWEQDPDSGIQALIDRYHAENPTDAQHTEPKRANTLKIVKKPKAVTVKPQLEKVKKCGIRRTSFMDSTTRKQCRCCGKVLPREMFTKDKYSPDGLAPRCRECKNTNR